MKKKLPKNVIIFNDPVYCQDYIIVITPSHTKFRRIIKELIDYDIEKEEDTGVSGCFYGITHPKKGDLGILWTKNRQCTLIHEIFHLTSWTLRNRDICLDSESSEESWAYYLTYIYRTIKERLRHGK